MRERKYYFKIIGIMFLSFIISSFLNGSVFIKNTSRIRPNLGKVIVSKISSVSTFLSQIQIPLPSFQLPSFTKQSQPDIADITTSTSSLPQISKGVYAEKNNTTAYTLIKEKEVEWKEYSIEINGTALKIKVPPDDPAPTSEMMQSAMWVQRSQNRTF